MSGKISERVRALLLQKDYDALLELCQRDRRYWKALRLYVYETDDHLCWPAVEAIARLMQQWWQQTREQAKAQSLHPILAYRVDRQDWRVVVPLSLINKNLSACVELINTAEMTVQMFCHVIVEGPLCSVKKESPGNCRG